MESRSRNESTLCNDAMIDALPAGRLDTGGRRTRFGSREDWSAPAGAGNSAPAGAAWRFVTGLR